MFEFDQARFGNDKSVVVGGQQTNVRQTAAEYEPKENLLKFRQPSPPPQEASKRLPQRLSSTIETSLDLTLSSPDPVPMGVYRGTGGELRDKSDSIPLVLLCKRSLVLTESIHSTSEEESDGEWVAFTLLLLLSRAPRFLGSSLRQLIPSESILKSAISPQFSINRPCNIW